MKVLDVLSEDVHGLSLVEGPVAHGGREVDYGQELEMCTIRKSQICFDQM